MTNPQHIDPERLAALLDGRLSDVEAAGARADLANADEETLSAYADAVAVIADVNSTADHVTAIGSARSRRWIAPAAALAAAAVLVVLVLRRGPATEQYSPSMYAMAMPSTAHAADSPVWSVTRGGSADVSDRARAVRIGVLLTDLQLDALRGDSAKRHAATLASLIEARMGNGVHAAAAREFVDGSTMQLSSEQSKRIGAEALRAADSGLVSAGAWLEAARIASVIGDSDFFDRAPMPAAPADIDASALRSLISTKPRDVTAIRGAVEQLLRSITI